MEHRIEVILSTDKTFLQAVSSKTRDGKESQKDERLYGRIGMVHGCTHLFLLQGNNEKRVYPSMNRSQRC